MAYGTEVKLASGKVTTNQTLPGGRVFLGLLVRSKETAGTVTVYTYPDVPGGSNLRVLQVGAGAHVWSAGTNGSGQATMTLTALTTRDTGFSPIPQTRLYVFTVATNEPDYGISMVNDAGERTVSGLFPAAEFLGKITFSSTPSSSYDVYEGTYWRFNHTSAPTSLGAGRTRMILWSLPNTTDDVWFTGTPFLSSAGTGSYSLNASYIRDPGTAFTMPEAFMFAIDGISPSAETYGMQVFNPSGQLTYDAGLDHMILRGYETGLSYPTSPGTINSFSASYFSGNTPAFSIPTFAKETWSSAGQVSNGKYYTGGVRRNGSTLESRLVKTDVMFEDIGGITGTYYYGAVSNLPQLVVDSTLYGGTI
jgi:hypothetical protein